ncbi:hypothetical protein J4457_04360 [Candidatus Woesearchaeota archaeon]|nr:hypothetical protein [Candidatus Woesearchaeota archaeon]
MTIIFKYKSVKRPDGNEVKTPSIPILLGDQERIETLALIDSGADISAMPLHLAQILKIDLNGKKNVSYGIGGKAEAIESHITTTVEKDHEKYTFVMPVKIICSMHDFPMLLGRVGFFDKFIIAFNQSQEKMLLKKFQLIPTLPYECFPVKLQALLNRI